MLPTVSDQTSRACGEPVKVTVVAPGVSATVAFGMGIHQCVGQHIARLEAICVLDALLDRIVDVEPAGVRAAFDRSFDQLGGLGPLLKDKTVTVKINLTGSKFNAIHGRPVGESYMTHPATVMALFVIVNFAHARSGLLVVIEDYIHEHGSKFAVITLLNLAAFGGTAFGLLSIVRLALGA